MFGFGKKKLDDHMFGMISAEVSMYMRWVEDNCRRMLKPHETEDIARRILVRENFKFSEEIPQHIGFMAAGFELDVIDKFRKKYFFDEQIEKFCKSIDIPMPAVSTQSSPTIKPKQIQAQPPKLNSWVYNKKAGVLTKRATKESYKDMEIKWVSDGVSGYEILHGKAVWVNKYDIDFE